MKKKKSKFRGLFIGLGCVALAILIVFGIYFFQKFSDRVSTDMTKEDLQFLLNDTIADLPNSSSPGANYIAEHTTVTVDSFSIGMDKNIILECSYTSIDIKSVIEQNLDRYIESAYDFYITRTNNKQMASDLNVMLHVKGLVESDLANAKTVNGTMTINVYEVSEGVFVPHLDYATVNTFYGGILDAKNMISGATSVIVDGETINISNFAPIRKGVDCYIALDNYDSAKPDTSVPIEKLWNSLKADFHRNFIEDNRYMYLVNGLLTTLKISALAALFGIALGFIIAVIRCINQKTGKISFLSGICKVYISIMRGTPLMVQLLIIYFVLLAPLELDAFTTAVICFGLNSGAYVSEIVRGGIMSIDEGQTEAGRSLGFNYIQTMWYIIIPQAFKAVLPSLANEFITLLKETSIAFYIGVADLTLGGNRIRSQTFSNFMPLIAVALIYLVLVLGLSKLVELLERRLAKSDRR